MKKLSLILLSITTATATPVETIARTILGEARGEGLIGMALVADVVHERSIRSGKSPEEICTAPRQFAGQKYQPSSWDTPEANAALELAELVAAGEDVVAGVQATHFWSGVRPYWANAGTNEFAWGRHTFTTIEK